MLAIARLSAVPDSTTATFALIVDDAVQGRGLGTALLKQLIQFARERGIRRIKTPMLVENKALQRVCDKMGFRLEAAGHYVIATLDLAPSAGNGSANSSSTIAV